MRVKVRISHKDTGGLFRRHRIEVTVAIGFTEEEEAIIRTYRLVDVAVLERKPDVKLDGVGNKTEIDRNVYIRHVLQPYKEIFPNPVLALDFSEAVKNGLRNLKEYLVRSSIILPTSEAFVF